MFTYTCERSNIIQIALKGLPGGGKKSLSKKQFARQKKRLAMVEKSIANFLAKYNTTYALDSKVLLSQQK
jgi:hypothetical protein